MRKMRISFIPLPCSSTTAIWEVPLWFLDAPGFPLQKYIKIGKVPKIAGNRVFGHPSHVLSIEEEKNLTGP